MQMVTPSKVRKQRIANRVTGQLFIGKDILKAVLLLLIQDKKETVFQKLLD